MLSDGLVLLLVMLLFFPVGAVARALPGQASGQLECCDVADAFLNLPLHPNVWHSCSSSCSLFRFSGAAGSDVLQCLMHLLCSASLVRPGLRALSTSSMCVRSPACIASGAMSLTLWPAAMVGSQELPVLRRWCWGIWGLVVSLNNLGFGKNNLVPTVTVSFDALEAGDTVEGLFDS